MGRLRTHLYAPMLRLAPFALLILLTGCSSSRVASPSITSAELQRAVEAEIDGFEGVVGVYVRHLETGATAEVRPDELFPTASMIKVPIMVTVFDRIEAGEIDYSADVMFVDSLRYSEYDLFGDLRDSSLVPVHQLVELMLSASDNTSSLWLQAMVTGEYINEWLAANGFEGTRNEQPHRGATGRLGGLWLGPDDPARDGGAGASDRGGRGRQPGGRR